MGELIGLVAVSAPFVMVVAIVWMKHQQKLAEMGVQTTAQNTAEKAAQYATQIQRLEDRVQVLERIVTDRGYDVATQIEALRDSRSVEDRDSGMPLTSGTREKV